MSKERQSWGTPKKLFDQLHSEYELTIDACAEEWNTKLPRYWTEEDDALQKSWKGERVFCNPPYKNIMPWVRKAVIESRVNRAFCLMLLPVRHDQKWFHEFVKHLLVDYFVGRIQFDPPPGIKKSSNTEASMLVYFSWGVPIIGHVDSRCAKTGEILYGY